MQDRLVLISDDIDFFDYMIPKLSLRKSDEVYRFSFDEIPEKLHQLKAALLLINAENKKEKTFDLLKLLKDIPAIAFSYNYDEEFAIQAYKLGLFDYITLSSSDIEITAKLTPALNSLSALKRNDFYREILVKNNLISENNEVFLDYCNVLDRELIKLNKSSSEAILCAISPDEKSKLLIQPYQIETAILNNIRSNDILMNFGINKYFLLLYNTNISYANKICKKIQSNLPQKIYAGIVNVNKKSRQQLVNDALNKLHEEISKDIIVTDKSTSNDILGNNFKLYKQEFKKKIEKIIAPVFFAIQQKYNNKLYNMKIEQGVGDGYSILYIIGRYAKGSFRITSPGLSKINIDISYEKYKNGENNKTEETKRINLEPEELEAGILEDLIEQFITEFKSEVANEYIK